MPEIALRVLVGIIGVAIVVMTVLSAVKTFVLPRSSNTMITSAVFRSMWMLFRFRLRKSTTYAERDQVMALYAPLSLLALPVVWLTLVLIGYACIYWSVGVGQPLDAFRLSGSSLLTLGFAMDAQTGTLALEFSEAALGLILVALLIAYLPTMYAAFSKRESMVNMLEVRAGAPPSAVELITRVQRIRGFEVLHELWEDWEVWFVEVEESHTTFAPLVFFRSPQPGRSWVTASGAILDAASLVNALIDIPHDAQADLTIRAGFLALRRVAAFFNIEFDPSPRPTDPISIARFEFDQACQTLAAAGVPLKPDLDQAWRDYAGWRVNYDRVLLELAALTMAPYAPWVSDRSIPRLGRRRDARGPWRAHEARQSESAGG